MKKVAELYYIQTPEVLLEWARKDISEIVTMDQLHSAEKINQLGCRPMTRIAVREFFSYIEESDLTIRL